MRKSAKLRELSEETFIFDHRRPRPGLTDAIIAAWQRSGCHPRLGQEAPQLNSTLNLVAAGLGVSIVPESLRHLRMNEITYLRLTGDGPRAAIGLVSRVDQRSAAVEISFPSPAGSRRSTRVSARLRNNAAQIRNAELRDVKRSDWQAPCWSAERLKKRQRIQHVTPGWGGRDRTSEWRNQNQMISLEISSGFLNFITPFSH
jgi:hypothetical protein